MQQWEYQTVYVLTDSQAAIGIAPTGKTTFQQRVYRVNDILTPADEMPRAPTITEYIKKQGEDGWELVAVQSEIYYFKRPIETT